MGKLYFRFDFDQPAIFKQDLPKGVFSPFFDFDCGGCQLPTEVFCSLGPAQRNQDLRSGNFQNYG